VAQAVGLPQHVGAVLALILLTCTGRPVLRGRMPWAAGATKLDKMLAHCAARARPPPAMQRRDMQARRYR